MEQIYPDYYEHFACIGGECRHNCCIGWEIDIDEKTINIVGCDGYRVAIRKEEIEKLSTGFKKLNSGCIKGTNCGLFVKIMIKVVIFNALALIF